MKALVLEKYGHLVYRDEPDPKIRPDEALVRIRACGICGSDVHGFDGSSGRRIPPLIMGHEASGVVEDIGPEVTGWKVGDRVTFDSTLYPADDWYARHGRYNLSDRREVFGVSPGEYRRHGAFAELLAVPQHVLHKIPDSVSFEEAAMVEPVAVALHAINRAQPRPIDHCAIVGVGTIGLFILKLLKLSSQGTIAAIDLSAQNRERALRFGADLALDPNDPELGAKLKAATSGRGPDVIFEAVGIEPTVNLALEHVRKGGDAVLVGNLSPNVNLPLQTVVTRELTLHGSCAICGEYPAVLELMASRRIDVSQDIVEVAPLSEGAAWFDRLYKGGVSGKVILKP